MKKRILSPLQRKVRAAVVKGRGQLGQKEIAEKLGIDRSTVWRALQVIQEINPLPQASHDEVRAIQSALAWHDTMIAALMDELQQNEHMIDAYDGAGVVGFLNIRLGLLRQIHDAHTTKHRFMMDIGLMTQAPQELIVTHRGLQDMQGAELDAEISRLNAEIAELEARGGGTGPASSD